MNIHIIQIMSSENDKIEAVAGFSQAAIIESLWGDEIRRMAAIQREITRIRAESETMQATLRRAAVFVNR